MPGRIVTPETAQPIDFSGLRDPVVASDVRAYRRAVTTPLQRRLDRRAAEELAILSFFGVLVGPLLVVLLVWAVVSDSGPQESVGVTILTGIFAGLVLLLLAWLVFAFRRDIHRLPSWSGRFRMERFARTNGLVYVASTAGIAYPGAIFRNPARAARSDVFTVSGGRRIQFGNYRQETNEGGGGVKWRWGYLMIELDRRLPHMFVHSKTGSRRQRNAIGVKFLKGQAMSLEGDFDKYFTLYAPKEYERDALYVFTPDLMALLIDRASQFDVEIVDNWLFVYSRTPFDFSRARTHRRIAQIIRLVGVKATNQTALYADGNVGDPGANIVAPAGRRLRRRISIGAGAVVFIYIGLRLAQAFLTIHGG